VRRENDANVSPTEAHEGGEKTLRTVTEPSDSNIIRHAGLSNEFERSKPSDGGSLTHIIQGSAALKSSSFQNEFDQRFRCLSL
jgi:hypothetical protein